MLARIVTHAGPDSPDGPVERAISLTAVATALAVTLQFHDGRLEPFGFIVMAASLGVLGWALLRLPPDRPSPRDETSIERFLGLAVALVMAAQFTRRPGVFVEVHGLLGYVPFFAGIAATATVLTLAVTREHLRLALLGLLAFHLMLGAWVIRHSPNPLIDVVVFQRDGVAALLSGHNPYALTFPNIYSGTSFYDYYGPGMTVGGRLQFGFPYPPLSLLLAIPGEVFGGDFRYSQLIAMTTAGLLIACARGGRIGLWAAALYLFAPRSFFVLEQGWTEPYLVLLLALVAFCACRFRSGLGIALGLFLASKQYLILAVPLLPLLQSPARDRDSLRRFAFTVVVPAAAVAAVVTIPFALWNIPAFVHDVVTLQVQQPFRQDALTFLAAFAYLTGVQLPSILAFVAAIVATVVAWRHCPRTPSGFISAVAFVFFAFFAFNKQAFCNYYTFIVGALCVALGAWQPRSAGREERVSAA
jgi:hypothetical protein